MLPRAMKPRRRRRVIRPGMMRASVIDHVIDEDLHPQPVGIRQQRLVFLHRAHVIIERVEVDHVVPVVVGVCILPHRCQPNSVHSKIAQIIQVLANTAQIAPVISHRIAAVINASRAGRLVVRQIAVGEAIGHDQVDDIVARKTFKGTARLGACQQRQLD